MSTFRLKTKYNTINRQLSLSGAGVTIEQLLEDLQKQNIYEQLQPMFPWWDNLHRWWKDNPSFNYSFSTANSGWDFVAACNDWATIPQDQGEEEGRQQDDELDFVDEEESEVEPGEIIQDHCTAAEDSLSQNQSPVISPSLLCVDISLSTPATLSCHSCLPASSKEESGINGMFHTFLTHAHKVTGSKAKGKQSVSKSKVLSFLPINHPISSVSHPPPTNLSSYWSASQVSSHASSSPCKHAHDTNELTGACGGIVQQDDTKHFKYLTLLSSKDLEAQESHDQCEHGLHILQEQHTHEKPMANQETKNLQLKMEIEKIKLEHMKLAMQLQHAGGDIANDGLEDTDL
ncbi:hypothetical protein EDD16DRAFT_1710516 [Pisolithus croceorrhizus]|nr:hypothetical protein EDD16DRAFT_1710516 [Pisolithus croceorrhizus]